MKTAKPFWEIERPANMEAGKPFVGLFDPKMAVEEEDSEQYGTRYTLLFLTASGPQKLTGGARLYEAVRNAILDANPGVSPENIKPCKLEILAHGKAGTFERGFTAKVVS